MKLTQEKFSFSSKEFSNSTIAEIFGVSCQNVCKRFSNWGNHSFINTLQCYFNQCEYGTL